MPEGNFQMVAKTFYGLEDVLAEELRNLGAMRVETARRAVSFYGDKGFLYKANLCLRTALSVLVPLKTDKVASDTQLYRSVYNLPWERYLTSRDTLAVDATVASEIFTNSHYVTLRVKDAIVDRIRDKMNARPDIDRDNPSLKVNVHLADRTLTLSLDSSLGLHRRGYRQATNIAPINEVLAAGLVLLSGWRGQTNLMDPMCGSGTLLIEAAMVAANIPAASTKSASGSSRGRISTRNSSKRSRKSPCARCAIRASASSGGTKPPRRWQKPRKTSPQPVWKTSSDFPDRTSFTPAGQRKAPGPCCSTLRTGNAWRWTNGSFTNASAIRSRRPTPTP